MLSLDVWKSEFSKFLGLACTGREVSGAGILRTKKGWELGKRPPALGDLAEGPVGPSPLDRTRAQTNTSCR